MSKPRTSEKNVMSVMIPVFDVQYKTADKNDIYSYGTAFTSAELDNAVSALSEIMPDMLRLAEIEKSCQLLAGEIEKTGSSSSQVFSSCSDHACRISCCDFNHTTFEEFEETFGVFLFLFSCFHKYSFNLFVTFFFGHACEERVTTSCLRFTGK